MTVDSKTFSRTRLEKPADAETVQTLGIFCGAGLLLSLLVAMSGWV
jgi:hypothetical protein